jgi:hypothetical protein
MPKRTPEPMSTIAGSEHRDRRIRRARLDRGAGSLVVLLLWMATGGAPPAVADHDRTDVVVLVNGDRFQGEIKRLEQGSLSLKTDAADTISVKWSHVASLVSRFDYHVRSTGRMVYYGRLATPDRPGELKIVGPAGTHTLALSDVFLLAPIEHSFWGKLDGSINLGFSYTESNQAFQYSLSGDTQYRTLKWIGDVRLNSIFNSQEDGDSASQQNLGFSLVRTLKKRRNVFGLAQLQSNPAQGFDLRSLVGGGAGMFLQESAGGFVIVSGGLVVDREHITESPGVDTSLEALVGLRFSRYRSDFPKRSLNLVVDTFTNLTNTPRFRVQLSFRFSWEIVRHLHVSLNLLDSYDSRPPTVDASKTDLSVTSSVGYTF